MIRVLRHPLGPRCFVLGRRLHEWHCGIGMLPVAVALVVAGHSRIAALVAVVGAWLIAKDYNDLIPSRRDSRAWSLGVHRRPQALRERRQGASLPVLFAALTAAVGVSNLVPGHAPAELVLAARAFVMPAGLALLVLAGSLARRRRRALWLTVVLLAAIGGLELMHDPEEAVISWSLLALLVWGRNAFTVRPAATPGVGIARSAAAFAAAAFATTLGVVLAQRWTTPDPTTGLVAREVGALLTLSRGPLVFADAFAWLPLAAGIALAGAIVYSAWELFRPLRAVHPPATALARRLVREHGHDTLSAFKLRPDLSTLVARDGRAFLSYRVNSGVLLIAGDPVGPADALPALLRELCAFASERGLRLGAVGASEQFAQLARDAGLHALYLGDEAIVATRTFSLEGKPIKKVRQAVNRLAREGFTASVRSVGDLDPAELEELEAVSARWRAGAAERGFSMAMDGLRGDHLADSVVVVARDRESRARGFLHFVPAYGAPVMSLSAMRRDRDTPNGLTEFLIVRAIEALRETGIEELSLNFAAFARWLHSPRNRVERVLGRVVRWANPYFQIESLYTFNAKFFPRWAPRYLLHDGPVALPRTALAALWVEGQLPQPRLRVRLGQAPAARPIALTP